MPLFLSFFPVVGELGGGNEVDAAARLQEELEKERAHSNAMQFLSEVSTGCSLA